jgi:hypothetical protein
VARLLDQVRQAPAGSGRQILLECGQFLALGFADTPTVPELLEQCLQAGNLVGRQTGHHGLVLAPSRSRLCGRRRAGVLLRFPELLEVRLDRPARDKQPATQPHGAQVASSNPILDGLQADPEGPRCLPGRQVLASRAAGRLTPGERLGQYGLDGPGALGLA